MEKMKKVCKNEANNNVEVPKQKERHIVSWSQEEDDILREQIRLHGTENWTIIASKFKDKTTRQCRRRWFTYLNSDFKKGGWSPEEDMLLCEAQKIFGNRWTEIAKVVSGRTDNAVKNRFTTLCKKRAKREALSKVNSMTSSYINLNNKRVIFPDGLNNADGESESASAIKRPRLDGSSGERGLSSHLLRHSFQMLTQKVNCSSADLPIETQIDKMKEASTDETVNNKGERTFLKKDDPKVLALIQQAELLSSLAVKVNTEKTDQSLENAWAVLQNFLKQNKESDTPIIKNSDADFRIEKLKELVEEELRSPNEGSVSSWRDRDAYDSSPASSEHSSESIFLCNVACDHQETEHELQSGQANDNNFLDEENGVFRSAKPQNEEFNSPVRVTPFFRALAAAIPSPKFSESEKHFLMKTLGVDSNSQSPIRNSSQQTSSCKRSLLHCL
ncbi:Duplicated homeodomain-like superfamily protein [Striga hermonthica]|uniref:Duplicated homeodomain-like superfamily protein n=1 Tax=Striga hermonthica TaxID=68872 RepID=A0A9N7RPH4_STRHE|nr:Duplicated homeodomain-like superfamily protein [Striga hermonthica]